MSAWTEFVKKVAKRDGISYKEAMQKASGEYKKKDKAVKPKADKKVKEKVPKKGEVRKGAKGMAGARLAFDDTPQEMAKEKKEKKAKK